MAEIRAAPLANPKARPLSGAQVLRHQNCSVIIEGDQETINQPVEIRREQQPVELVQPLSVSRARRRMAQDEKRREPGSVCSL